MIKISISVPCEFSPCEYIVDDGLLDKCAEFFKDYSKIAIVVDENVDKLFGDKLSRALEGLDVVKFIIPSGEKSKSFSEYEKLINGFATAELLRNSAVICFGGGVVGDLGGFAASTFMRGIDYFQIPTTLVAMIDSSIGGKTGIDLPAGKNLAGAFKQPKAILVDPSLISNLPEREVKNGLGEMVKHAFIADMGLVPILKTGPKSSEAILRSAKVKLDIVGKDFNEGNERKYLNVGHTIGHAIEHLSEYKLAHGEAVIKGIYFESFIATELEILQDFNVVGNALNKLDLDYSLPDFDLESIWETMLRDKKNTSSEKVTMSLISIAGEKIEVREITKDIFLKYAKKLYAQ